MGSSRWREQHFQRRRQARRFDEMAKERMLPLPEPKGRVAMAAKPLIRQELERLTREFVRPPATYFGGA